MTRDLLRSPRATATPAPVTNGTWALLIASALLCGVHVRMAVVLGALWRDEANSVAMATMTTLREVLANLPYDNNPLFSTLLFRLWSYGPWGVNDTSWRVLGLSIGVGIIIALWTSARWLGVSSPWVSLPLFGFSATVIRWGDSIRPNGVATLCLILYAGAMWRLAQRTSGRTMLVASVLAVCAVQTIYHASILIATISIAALVSGVQRRSARESVRLLVPGIAAAVSLLPYLPVLRDGIALAQLIRAPGDPPPLSPGLAVALWPAASWVIALSLGVLAAVAILLPSSSARLSPAVRPLPHRAERIVYGITTIVLGIAAYVAFLRWLRFPSQPWYYLPVMGVTATALDAVCFDLRARAMRLGVASAAWAAAAVSLATGDLRSRNSTADVAAGYVRKSAVSGDFVVVSPWYLGVSFARYYDGDAEWETAPPLSDHRIHRFDLVARHKSSRGVAPLRDHVMATLAAGGTVWWVTTKDEVDSLRQDIVAVLPGVSLQDVTLPGTPKSYVLENFHLLRSEPRHRSLDDVR